MKYNNSIGWAKMPTKISAEVYDLAERLLANGGSFLWLPHCNSISAYNKNGVGVFVVRLHPLSQAEEDKFIDLIYPAL